jgi:hypothetical protein
MRIKTKISAGTQEDRFLAPLARRLRDWLNRYLLENASAAARDSHADGDAALRVSESELEASAPAPASQGSDPREHWLHLVQSQAPELLIPSGQAGTSWQPAQEEAPPMPEACSTSEVSHQAAAPRLDQTQERSAASVQSDADTVVPSNSSRRTAWNRQDQLVPETRDSAPATQQPTWNAASRQAQRQEQAIHPVVCTEARLSAPPRKSAAIEPHATSRHPSVTTKPTGFPDEEEGLISRASPQGNLANDALLSRSISRPRGDQTTLEEASDQRSSSRRVTAPGRLQVLIETAARLRKLLRISSGDNSEASRPKTNLDSASVSSGSQRQEKHSKEQAPASLPAVSHQIRQQASERGLDLTQPGPVLAPAQLPGEAVKPLPLNGGVRFEPALAPSGPVKTEVFSYSRSDLWPRLAERLPENTGVQFAERMAHRQALDSEQRGDAAGFNAAAAPPLDGAESNVMVWPWAGESSVAKSDGDSSRTSGRVSSPPSSQRWPDLPDQARENNVDSVQFLRRLEQLQALDVEQRGAN